MVELKLEALDFNGSSNDTYVAIRVGESQKLSRLSASRYFKFPQSAMGERKFGKVDVFKKVGSASIGIRSDPNMMVQDLSVPCGEGPAMNLRVTLESPAVPILDKPAVKESTSKAVAEAKRYLVEHNLEMLVSDAMQSVLREKPANPAQFIADKLTGIQDTYPKRAQTAPAGASRSTATPGTDTLRQQAKKSLEQASQNGGFAASLDKLKTSKAAPPPPEAAKEEAPAPEVPDAVQKEVPADAAPDAVQKEVPAEAVAESAPAEAPAEAAQAEAPAEAAPAEAPTEAAAAEAPAEAAVAEAPTEAGASEAPAQDAAAEAPTEAAAAEVPAEAPAEAAPVELPAEAAPAEPSTGDIKALAAAAVDGTLPEKLDTQAPAEPSTGDIKALAAAAVDGTLPEKLDTQAPAEPSTGDIKALATAAVDGTLPEKLDTEAPAQAAEAPADVSAEAAPAEVPVDATPAEPNAGDLKPLAAAALDGSLAEKLETQEAPA